MTINIPDAIRRASIRLLADEKRIDVTVVEAKPRAAIVSADVFVDVGVGFAAEDVMVDERARNPAHYMGVLPPPRTSRNFSQELQRAVFLTLKRAERDGMRSAWVNASDLRVKEFPLSMTDAFAAIVDGVRLYALHVRDDAPAQRIADIIVGGGATVLNTQMTEFGDVGNYLKLFLGELMDSERDERALALRVNNDAPAVVHDAMAMKWLEMIGGEIAAMARNPEDGFHRVSPSAPIMPRKSFTVFFDAQTGEPKSITSRNIPIDPEGLSAGMAAVQIYYLDCLGFIDPSEHLVTAEPLSQRAMDILQSLMGAKPIIPERGVRIEGLRDGVEVIRTEADHDEQNSIFAAALLNTGMNKLRMTIGFTSEYISLPMVGVLAEWLAQRTGKDIEQLDNLLEERIVGYQQYDIHVDRAGRFIGGSAYMDMKHTARGTEYKKGITTGGAGIARQIAVHTHVADDGTTHKVPVMEGAWEGDEGLAKRAFDRWYHSAEFEHMRVGVLAQDALSELVFADIGAKDRFAAFDEYLRGDAAGMQQIGEAHAMVRAKFVLSKRGKNFADIMKGMACVFARCDTLSRADEVGVMYLEMLMRNALGDGKVDELLRSKTSSSPNGQGGPNGPCELPSAGNGTDDNGQLAGPFVMQGGMNMLSAHAVGTASMMMPALNFGKRM